MIYGLDICAGSGIGSLAFEAIGLSRTVCYIERDAYCQRLLQQRMLDGWLSPAPIWDDLKTFDGRPWRGLVDFVFGGIPCQPWSVAGKRRGALDDRDLIGEFVRVVRQVGPAVVLVENTPGFAVPKRGGPKTRKGRARVATRWIEKAQQSGLGRLLGLLAEAGYDAEWLRLSAAAVGAPHRRDRVWIVAYSTGIQPRRCTNRERDEAKVGSASVADAQEQSIGAGLREGEQAGERRGRPSDGGSEGDLPHSDTLNGDGAGHRASTVPQQRQAGACDCGGNAGFAQSGLGRGPHGLACRMDVLAAAPAAWEDGTWEDGLPRVAEGVPERVNRLRVIGNGWVPQVAAVIAARIGGF